MVKFIKALKLINRLLICNECLDAFYSIFFDYKYSKYFIY